MSWYSGCDIGTSVRFRPVEPRAERDELVGPVVRQRPQQHRVDHAEDRGVGADAERQRQHGDEREGGAPRQSADRESKVPPERIHHATSRWKGSVPTSRPSKSSTSRCAWPAYLGSWVTTHSRGALAVELREQVHDLGAVPGVEVPGGLIGEQHQRPAGYRARHRDTLLLAARQLSGIVMDAVKQTHPLERLVHGMLALRGRHAAIDQRQLDVPVHVEVADQVEGLEDEADRAGADPGALGLVESRHGLAGEDVAALARRVEQTENRQQRRLAAARRTADGDVLAGPNLQVDAGQRVGLHLLRMEDLGDAVQPDQGIVRDGHG